jgi:hypothetical protein
MGSAVVLISQGVPELTGEAQLLTVEDSVGPSRPTRIGFGSSDSQ